MFDIEKVPFSRFGSYLSLLDNDWGPLGKGLYIRLLFGKTPQVFKVDPVLDGETRSYTVETSPSCLTLKPEGGGRIDLVIDDTDALRVRSQGAGVQLSMSEERWTFAYEQPRGWAFNLSTHHVQVGLEVLQGAVAVDAPWERGKGFCWETRYATVMLTPHNDVLEVALDHFVTTWLPPERTAFDECRLAVETQYRAWSEHLPAAQLEFAAARDLAAYVNWSACVSPAGFLTRPTMLMSKAGMCNVYHWDHAFNAIAHCNHRPELAWDQLLIMADAQDAHGKPPSSMNRGQQRYTISNPPVQGWALSRMWALNPGLFTPARMQEAYDYLAGWTNWICTHRTWPGDILPYYHHGFDSGWDNSSIFDGGVPVISPDQPAYLVLQMEALAELARGLGQDAAAKEWENRSASMLQALLEELWLDDDFVGLRRPSGERVRCNSLITCMPIVLGKRLPEPVIQALVARIRTHLTPYGPATEALDSAHYLEGGYWRGPIWAPSTMLIVDGLQAVGESDLAHQVMVAFCRMCADVGFYENFSPKTGEGHYDSAYTWTSSVFMCFQRELVDAG